MQIVINISEESYKNIKEQVDKRDYPDMQIGRAIADGTPIPKGHGGLIAKSEILNFLKCPEYENCDWKNCSDCNRSRCINSNNVNKLVPIVEEDKEIETNDVESDDAWCNTCEYKHLESECCGCAKYDEYDNLIALSHYKKESEE